MEIQTKNFQNFSVRRFTLIKILMLVYHITPTRNIDKILNIGLEPRCGTRSTSCGEKNKTIWVFPDISSLEYGIDNWLENMFSEKTKLSLLEILIIDDNLNILGYEANILNIIPAENIRVITRDIDTLFSYNFD